MSQPYGYAPVPTSNPGLIQVTVPSGIQPGQSFDIIANNQRMTITCPAGFYPGMTMSVQPPPPQPQLSLQQPNYSVPQTAPMPTGTLLDVTIPSGCQPGMTFEVIFNGQKIGIQCPPNCVAGQVIRIQLPGAPSPAPAPAQAPSPAPNVVAPFSVSSRVAPSPVTPSPAVTPPASMVPATPPSAPRSYQVAIPAGSAPGAPFTVTVGGRQTSVVCPPNGKVGKIIEIIV